MPLKLAAPSSRAVPVLIAAGFALRLGVALRAGIIEHDGAYYAGLAAALLRGDVAHGLSTVWPPLYPALIAMFAMFADAAWPFDAARMPSPERLEIIARLVSVVAGTVALGLLHRWTRQVAGERWALVALAVAAFHPRLVQYSASALTEMTFIALLLAGLMLIAAGDERPGGGRDLAAGAAFGLACLARPEGAVLAVAVAVALAVRGLRTARAPNVAHTPGATHTPSAARGRGVAHRPDEGHAPRPARRNLRLAFVLGVIVVVMPWVAFLNARLGYVSLGEKGAYNFWREFKPEYRVRFGDPTGLSERVFESPELAASTPLARVGVASFVRAEPALVITRSLGRLARIVTQSIPQSCYPAWFALALLGMPLLVRPALWPAAAMLVAFPLLYAPFAADRRFFVPAVPLLLALVPAGIDRLAAWVSPPARRALLGGALAATLALAGLIYTLVHPLMDHAPEHRVAGTWLRGAWPDLARNGSSFRPVVMSRKTWVGYYAHGLIAELPEGGIDAVLARARHKRADVLVVDERWAVPNRPELAPLLDPALAPLPLRVLHVIDTPRRLVLYDVRGAR